LKSAVASEGMMAAAHDPRARLRRLHEVGISEAMFDSVVYVVGLCVAAGVSYLCSARARIRKRCLGGGCGTALRWVRKKVGFQFCRSAMQVPCSGVEDHWTCYTCRCSISSIRSAQATGS